MTLNLIVALATNNAIGYCNKIPWYIPDDLKWFRKCTLNNTIIMGRNTFESLNSKPLPDRKNIVVSSKSIDNSNVLYLDIKKTKEYIEINRTEENIFIIGGPALYEEFIKDYDYLYVTYIYKDYEADTYFSLDTSKFEIYTISEIENYNDISYQHFIYKKNTK